MTTRSLHGSRVVICTEYGHRIDVASTYADGCGVPVEANAHLIAAAPCLLKALIELADLFAIAGENSVARFDRLAAMFHADTGYLAPGKDHPTGGSSTQEGRDALNAIYDGWYSAKVDRARAVIARATSKEESHA